MHEERYFTEKEIGPDKTDPISGRPLQRIEEKNYFFRMSAFQDRLIEHIHRNPEWIVPESRKNEILGFLQKPLEDLSISRPKARLSWGIPLPFDEEHVCYVWVDALINYLTASGAVGPNDEVGPELFKRPGDASWWPADLHIVGKDIVTTHAVYWPTLLMAADMPVPRQILAHGWWVAGDTKMSKSIGNVIDPLELARGFGTDAVRWYLLREMPTGSDASYTPERFAIRYEELANVLGNLASRTIAMISKYCDSRIPNSAGQGLTTDIEAAVSEIEQAMAAHRIHDALGTAMDLARRANSFIEEREPWAQAKDPNRAADLDETLTSLARALSILCALFQPVCPGKMAVLASRLGLDGVPTLTKAKTISLAGRTVHRGDPLFPRVQTGE